MQPSQLDGSDAALRALADAAAGETAIGPSPQPAPGAGQPQRELQNAQAENDALRADIDALLAELDDAREESQTLRTQRQRDSEALAAAVAERDQVRDELAAAAAERARVRDEFAAAAAERDLARDELTALESRERDHLREAAGLRERLSEAARELQRAGAEAKVAAYRRSVETETRDLRESVLQEHTALMHGLAQHIEASRADQVWNATWLEAELASTLRTVSWRVSRPLRAVRRGWNTAAARLSGGRWGFTAQPALPGPEATAIPPMIAARAESTVLDIEHYRRCYPGLALLEARELLDHYLQFGRAEGRSGLSPLGRSLRLGGDPADERDPVLVLVIAGVSERRALEGVALIRELARDHHVVSVLDPYVAPIVSEPALPGTVIVLPAAAELSADDFRALAAELAAEVQPRYVVAVSEQRCATATALQGAGVPVIDLAEARRRASGLPAAAGDAGAGTAPPAASRVLPEQPRDEERSAFHYATTPQELELRTARARAQQELDLEAILDPTGFDAAYASDNIRAGRRQLAQEYLRHVRLIAPLRSPNVAPFLSRPRPGFHPLVYAESAPGFVDDGRDPLAHFLRSGRPEGRWSRRLISPGGGFTSAAAPSRAGSAGAGAGATAGAGAAAAAPRVLVHGHFHYPELVTDFLELLAPNTHPRTLVLTTHSQLSAQELGERAHAHPAGRDATVLVVPNRGRNLSALLCDPVAAIVREHDLVLHVHGKRSPHAPDDFGRRWREHLWTHLVGDGSAFADRIVAEFAASPRLGLVAPEDRRLHDWDGNRPFVPAWLERLRPHLREPLHVPLHFDFPVGAMFWARSAALSPFLDAALRPTDCPEEPLPVDGTPLHALERLISLVAEHQGFEFAKSHLGPASH